MKKTIPCLSDGVKQIYLIEMHKKPSTQKTFEASALPIQAAPERVRHAALQHCATLLYHKTRFNNRVAIALQSSFQQDVECRDAGTAGISGGIIPLSQGLGKPMISFSRLATSFLTMEKVDLRCSQLDGRSAVMKTDN